MVAPTPKSSASATSKGRGAEAARHDEAVLGRHRRRRDRIDDLAISGAIGGTGGALARALAPISSATASFAFDRVSDVNTFTFNAAVGYGINWTVDDDRLGLMPFVYYKRIDLSGPGSEKGRATSIS